ncbi:hypothetical protein CLIM01_07364 [Colletotrichum limetticola]|uniref:Uncharacterized protein n=1 Tax=Colletotrichum limetticola TaxID=1209924 RepID=A0ABQ9PUY4_9PEZI|nr:hypothetical protein CLIM01_07364 [Colletotrichum limetticola]
MLADSVNRLRGANRQIGALHCADERAFSKSGRREGGGTTGGHRQAGSLPGKKQAASQDFPTDSFNPHTLLREPPEARVHQALGYSLSWLNPASCHAMSDHSRFRGSTRAVEGVVLRCCYRESARISAR